MHQPRQLLVAPHEVTALEQIQTTQLLAEIISLNVGGSSPPQILKPLPPPVHMSAFGQKNAAQIAADEAHQKLIDELDMHSIPKPFRNPNWRPNQRRNKNIKTILGDATRKEASLMPTQDNSEAATPFANDSGTSTAGDSTPEFSTHATTLQPNLAQASRNLSKLVLERNMKNSGFSSAPSATYTNIESAPTLAHPKHYCDITGLPAPYTDPKTRLRYHNKEVFSVVRSLGQGVAEQYLEARGAHTILK